MMRRATSYCDGDGILTRNLRQMSQMDRDLAAEIGEPDPSPGGGSSESSTHEIAAEIGKPQADPSDGDSSSTHVTYSPSDLRQWWGRQRGEEMGILACWDVHPAERLYDDELAAKLTRKKGDSEPISMDVLRQTDFQQLILWFAFGFRPAKETFSEKRQYLKSMLGGAISLEDACGAVERFLHGLKPVTVRHAEDKWCLQPAAMRRLC